MRILIALVTALLAGGVWAARIANEADAVAAAKAYTKGKCNTKTPCTYRARREGSQWNVFVQLKAGGHLILYFDAEGNLVRRIEGD